MLELHHTAIRCILLSCLRRVSKLFVYSAFRLLGKIREKADARLSQPGQIDVGYVNWFVVWPSGQEVEFFVHPPLRVLYRVCNTPKFIDHTEVGNGRNIELEVGLRKVFQALPRVDAPYKVVLLLVVGKSSEPPFENHLKFIL